ncbi:MAG: Smr/MutS family protein [Oscillospiraceae bacterium]|jgi:hypothetical protein|nr:Smr/MutS family protein [Oscillospiraceae bacterium]
MTIRKINLEDGLPTAAAAVTRLNAEILRARAQRVRALKIIHGWGSSGKGGVIRLEVHKELRKKSRAGQIKAFVPGEELNPFSQSGRAALALCPDLARDPDYSRNNAGVSFVVP